MTLPVDRETLRSPSSKRVLPFGIGVQAENALVVLVQVPGATPDEFQKIWRWLQDRINETDLHYMERKVLFMPHPSGCEMSGTDTNTLCNILMPQIIRRLGGNGLPRTQ